MSEQYVQQVMPITIESVYPGTQTSMQHIRQLTSWHMGNIKLTLLCNHYENMPVHNAETLKCCKMVCFS